jgi:hypothetical protein
MVDDFNDPLRASNEEHQDLRLRLRQLPSHSAPTSLIHALKRDFIGPSWSERFAGMFTARALWRPIGAAALVALITGVAITNRNSSEKDGIDIQPLVTAHARYQSESMVPAGDLAGAGFGFQLASYYGEDN